MGLRTTASWPNSALTESIASRVDISVKKHGSQNVAVVGHYDCARNPAPEDKQKQQLDLAVGFLAARYPGVRVTSLWVNSAWSVEEQAVMFSLLDTSEIGVSLSDSMIMSPIKSLSLIMGTGPDPMGVEGASNCDFCSIKEWCNYRHKRLVA